MVICDTVFQLRESQLLETLDCTCVVGMDGIASESCSKMCTIQIGKHVWVIYSLSKIGSF